jgi:hypothetical protein
VLQVHAKASEILLAGVLFVQEAYYDHFAPTFREILDLVRSVAKHTSMGREPRRGYFWFGPLVAVVSRGCKVSGVRSSVVTRLLDRGLIPRYVSGDISTEVVGLLLKYVANPIRSGKQRWIYT